MIEVIAILFFVLPLLAGGLVRIFRPQADHLRLLLAFSGAFLLAVVFLHMLPDLYGEGHGGVGTWVLAGFLLQVALEYYSRGIEHGHLHATTGQALPLLTLLSLCIHSFVEGMPFADAGVAANRPFVAGVLLHKMPMAIALATVLLRSGSGRSWSWIVLLVFAAAAPAGILVGWLAADSLGGDILHRLLGLAIGMLLHIGATIIFESAPEHRMRRDRALAVLLGVLLAALSSH